MSFQPLKEGNISTSLLGTADPGKFVDASREDLFDRRINSPEDKLSNIRRTLIIIIISAIIFVTVISIYDVIKLLITNYFARQALVDPKSQNKREDIERTIISNQDSLKSSIWFSLFCLITGIILIWILIKFLS
jgi:hypothetical protein